MTRYNEILQNTISYNKLQQNATTNNRIQQKDNKLTKRQLNIKQHITPQPDTT